MGPNLNEQSDSMWMLDTDILIDIFILKLHILFKVFKMMTHS